MMKKLIVTASLLMLMAGCASVTFNPDTGEVKYKRIGDQHIQGLEIKRSADGGVKLKMEGQQSEAEALTEAIRVIGILTEVTATAK